MHWFQDYFTIKSRSNARKTSNLMSIKIKDELYRRFNDLNSFSFLLIVKSVVLKVSFEKFTNFRFARRRRDVWRLKRFSCWWRQLTNWNILYQKNSFVVVDFERVRFEVNTHFNDSSINHRWRDIATICVTWNLMTIINIVKYFWSLNRFRFCSKSRMRWKVNFDSNENTMWSTNAKKKIVEK